MSIIPLAASLAARLSFCAALEPASTSGEPPAPAPPAAEPSTPTGGPADTEDVGVVEQPEKDPTVFPDPDKFSRGFFAEGALGPVVPVGPTSRVLSTGFSMTARSGYEIRRWIALQAHASAAFSKYDDGILGGEVLQQYTYTGEVRFGIPIRRFLIAIQGGAGAFQVDSNLLQVADIASDNRRFFFAWDASLAFDIHSLSRHFSGGLVATFVGIPQLQNAGALSIGAYLRFTL